MQGLQGRLSDIVLLGGMASAHNRDVGTALFLDGKAYEDGAVLLGIKGLRVRPIVAQGAEPLGRPLTITPASATWCSRSDPGRRWTCSRRCWPSWTARRAIAWATTCSSGWRWTNTASSTAAATT